MSYPHSAVNDNRAKKKNRQEGIGALMELKHLQDNLLSLVQYSSKDRMTLVYRTPL